MSDPPRGAWFRVEDDKQVIGASLRTRLVFVILALLSPMGLLLLAPLVLLESRDVDTSRLLAGTMMGVAYWLLVVSFLFGKAEVVLQGGQGVLFLGFGPLGRRWRFDWDAVQGISSERGDIVLVGDGMNFSFYRVVSNLVTEHRMNFMRYALMYLKRQEMGF